MSDLATIDLQAAYACCGLTRTDAAENTLKAIWELSGDGVPVGTNRLAHMLGVTPPTTSAMVKRFVDHGLIERRDDRTLGLTEHGAAHARTVIRRHRLLETFLAEVLKVPWDEVYGEAELLEHAVSDSLLERIDTLLGHPTLDPHGDPIPQDEALTGGPVANDPPAHTDQALLDAPVGARFRIERLHNRNAEALRYLAELGLRPGVVVEVAERAPFDGPLWIGLGGQRTALGTTLAALVHGRVTDERPGE